MLSPSSSSTNTVAPLDSTITTNNNTSNSNSSFSLTISNHNGNNGEVTSDATTPKKNKRKRKNKSSSNTNSTSNSTAKGSSSTDQLNHGSSSLPLATRSVANPTTSTTDHHHQHNNHSRKSGGGASDQNKSKSHSPSPSTSSSVSSHSSSSNHHHHNNNNNQKQVKKNKQQSSSTSFKNNQSVATSTTTALVSGTNSKAGSLRGSGGQQQQNFVDKKKKGVLSTNKEIHGNQESKSPTHRQLLKKIKSKVSTENYSQVVKYKCFDSESQGEQELTMKKTSIINMAEIATSMNRRAQYLMKYIGFKTDKTCFFDVNDEIGYILHEHIAEVKKELTENGKYEEKNVKVQTLTGNTISMDDENQMSKLIDQILQSYVSNYMVCPSCKSIKTTNPIVVDHDQQQRILQEFKDDNNVDDLTEYQEEQLIERLDDFTFFTIQCRDCDHKERIDNANSSDEFIKQILKSRQRNLTKMFKQGQNEETYVEHESVPQVYGYPYQPEPPVYYYPYYVEVIPGEHNVYAPAGYYPPPMPNYYGYYPSFYPTQPVFSPHYDIAANQEPTENFERDPVVEQNYKSAGVIAYSIHQGKIYFLLGKENRGGKGDVNPNLNFEKGLSPYKIAKQMFTWSEFGGKKEKTDTNSAETAAREFYEETKAAFGDIYDKLSTSEGYYFENGKYNLFITELEYITSEQIQERSTIDSSVPFTEKVDLAWIDAEELMKRISDRTKQYYHAESGLMKIPVDGNENEFLHPFALSLFRFASKTLTKLIASIKN